MMWFMFLLGLIVGAIPLALFMGAHANQLRVDRDKARSDAATKDFVLQERSRALGEANDRAYEWKKQAIDLSRRNHELTELLMKKVETGVIPDGEIENPLSVAEADAQAVEDARRRHEQELARVYRPTNTIDPAARPHPEVERIADEDGG